MAKETNLVTIENALQLQSGGYPLGVSCGIGTDSVAILVEMARRGIQPDFVVFADTGAEKPLTYGYYSVLSQWLQDHGMPECVVVRRKPTTNTRGTYSTLFGQCLVNKTLPSLAFGFKKCSNKWKVEPMRYYERNSWVFNALKVGPGRAIIKAIGYDAGPKDSRRGTDSKPDGRYLYTYPLRDWNIDRDQCKKIISSAGLPDPEKSACFFCPASSVEDIREVCSKWPQLGRGIIMMEANAWDTLKKIRGLWSHDRKGFRSVKKPGSMTEFIVGEELLPEFVGQCWVQPWWQWEGKQPDNPNLDTFTPQKAMDVMARYLKANPSESPQIHELKENEELLEALI